MTKLYLENNLISSLDDIEYLSKLPCVEVLNLQKNPVTLNVDYRSHVLLVFGSQASEVSWHERWQGNFLSKSCIRFLSLLYEIFKLCTCMSLDKIQVLISDN